METATPYRESFNHLIHVITEIEELTAFNYWVYPDKHIAVVDLKRIKFKDAVEVITAAFRRISLESRAIYLQIVSIVNDVLYSRRTHCNGFIKQPNSDLATATLITAPYHEPWLDIRIVIGDDEQFLNLSRDYIQHDLGITSVSGLHT